MHALRDLANQIEADCREHVSYSQAWEVVHICADHLRAIARTHEATTEIVELGRLADIQARELYMEKNKNALALKS